MSKLIRFDEEHFGYLVDTTLSSEQAHTMVQVFQAAWPERKLIVMQADEFIDLTGQYEVVSITETVA